VRRAQGFPEKTLSKLEDYGFIQSRPKGEYHANNQQMSKLLHKAIGLGDRGAAPQVRAAAESCRARPPTTRALACTHGPRLAGPQRCLCLLGSSERKC
jgi:hypothetical protein